jgi:hypothetical protein
VWSKPQLENVRDSSRSDDMDARKKCFRDEVWFGGRDALLHISSSQKHMCPVPELSIIHT